MQNLWNGIRTKTLTQNQKLILLLIVGLIHGLIYVFVTPPWWHHDEPGHFQVAWFIANHERYPEWKEYDDAMRVKLVESLEHYNLFDYINYSPDSDEKIPHWVLAPQFKDPPLYYAVASLPLRLLKNTDLALQNRALRLLSLAFFLLFLWVSWELGGEVFGDTHPLRSLTSFFLALLPGFVNEMTAITNTPLGVLLFAVFLLMVVRLLKNGFSWVNFLFLGASVVSCYYTNNLIWLSMGLLTVLVLLFIPFRKRLRWLPWTVILIAAFILPMLVFEWGDARYWYRGAPAESYTRLQDENAPHGNYVLEVTKDDSLRQRIPVEYLKPQRSRILTLGFWAWASEPVNITAPRVVFSSTEQFSSSPSEILALSADPEFYSFQINVPKDSGRGWLQISPALAEGLNASIYFDGIVLAEGERNLGEPQFADLSACSGIWGTDGFTNLVRNGSTENAWLRISPMAWEKGLKRFPAYFSALSLAGLQDWQGSGWYFKRTLVVLNETFWGKFGPSTIPMLGSPYVYQFLRGIIFLGLLGAIGLIWKKFKGSDKRILLFFGLSILVIWGQTLLRGTTSLDSSYIVIPWTRYSLPAILPLVMGLCAGWLLLLNSLEKRYGIRENSLVWPTFIAFLLSLDMLSILTMLQFFYLQTQWPYLVFFIAFFLSLVSLMTFREKTSLNKNGE